MFEQITILGTGLLGASIAIASRALNLSNRIVVWTRNPETRARCAKAEWCDHVAETPAEAAQGSQLTVICTPVQTILPLLGEISPALHSGSIVTDVGSTKGNICAGTETLPKRDYTFIGSHPMAGSEQSGMDSATGDLFRSSACILTPLPGTDPEKSAQLHTFWQALGMTTHEMTPEQHDEIVAHISHLPHLLATAICNTLAKKSLAWRQLAGGGLCDSTRIAAGDPTLWCQILSENRDAILHSLQALEKELSTVKRLLEEKDEAAIFDTLASGKAYREGLPK